MEDTYLYMPQFWWLDAYIQNEDDPLYKPMGRMTQGISET